jgi:hypothetical protein
MQGAYHSIRPQKLVLIPWLHAAMLYLHTVKVATFINKVVDVEKVDLIISPHETTDFLVPSRIAGGFSKIPWSAILQANPIVGDSVLEGESTNIIKIASNVAKLYHGGKVAT